MAGLNGTITMQSGEYRPCTVNGKEALFHRWVEHESVILQSKCMFSGTKLSDIREVFERTKVVPNGFTAVKLGGTYAVVEFENGCTELVGPRDVKFLDSGNLFQRGEQTMKSSGSIIVSWDFSNGKDIGVLIVGRLNNGVVEIVNAFKGKEAEELYLKLTTKIAPKEQKTSFVEEK